MMDDFSLPLSAHKINRQWTKTLFEYTGNKLPVYTFTPQHRYGLAGTPVNRLFAELYPQIGNATKKKTKEAFQSILVTAYQLLDRSSEEQIVGFLHPLTTKRSKSISRYEESNYSNHVFLKTLKEMKDKGYFTYHKGFKAKDASQGIATLWLLENKLSDWLLKNKDHLDVITFKEKIETIRLKNSDKKLINYEDDESTNAMRKRVELANKVRITHKWLYYPLEDDGRTYANDMQSLSSADLTNYRIFNGDFKSGGRFYCPAQQLKKAERNTIEVNDGATVELDYKSLHPRLLYNMEGLEAPKDCYFLEGFDRDLVKSASLIAFNCNSIEQAVRALMKDQEITYEEATAVLTAFRDANQPIAHYLFQGNWKHLQYLDSQLVDLILEAATRENIPVLPVHDSFIVSTKYSSRLESIIYAAYKVLTGFDSIVAVEEMPDLNELESQLFDQTK